MYLHALALIITGFTVTACSTLKAENACPERTLQTMPRVEPELESLAFWINKLGDKADELLLTNESIRHLNAANQARPWAFQDVTSASIVEPTRVARELEERRVWLKDRLASGRYQETRPGLMKEAGRVIDASKSVDELRILTERTDLRCIPAQGKLFAPASTPQFDRNQCSGLAATHLVRVLRKSGPWYYVHGAHSVGWVQDPSWTPPLSAKDARMFRDRTPRAVVTKRSLNIDGSTARDLAESYPYAGDEREEGHLQGFVPTTTGLTTESIKLEPGLERGWLAFTRRNVLRLAFSELGRGYGWGETGGLTDCSRLLLDTFRPFGIFLGRHSSEQARSGNSVMDVRGIPDRRKRELIREASEDGIVFLYMPGHIMLYLGKHGERDYALSAIHSFRMQCSNARGASDAILGKVAVSDLLVGQNTQKKSFLSRLERIAIFGKNAGL